MVTVERGAVAQLEIRSAADSDDQGEQSTEDTPEKIVDSSSGSTETSSSLKNSGRKWIGKAVGLLVLVLLLVGGGVFAWRKWIAGGNTDGQVTVSRSTMAPESFSQSAAETNAAGHSAGEAVNLGASADGTGGTLRRPEAKAGRASSPSTIGSKVEIQSGISEVGRAANGGTENLADMGVAANETRSTDESVVANADAVHSGGVDRSETPARTPKLLTGSATMGKDPGSKVGGAPGLAVEGDGIDDSKHLPGASISEGVGANSKAKKKGRPEALGALAESKQGVSGTDPSINDAAPETPLMNAALDGTGANPPAAVPTQENGPVSKVVVVKKAPALGSASFPNEVQSAEDSTPSENKAITTPKRAAMKRTAGKSVPGAKTMVREGAEAENSAADSPSEEDGAPSPAADTKVEAQPKLSNMPNAKDGSSVPADKPAAAKAGVPVSTPRPPAKSGKPSSAISGADAGKHPLKKGDDTLQSQTPSDPSDTADDTQPGELDKTSNMSAASEARTRMAAYEISGFRWDMRLVRDAIVPTQPVAVGNFDTADTLRRKLLLERKAHMPETFKNHATHLGFVFVLPSLPAGGAFYWREVEGVVKRTVDGNQAEITWPGDATPRGSIEVLLFPDGREAVCLTVKENGRISLKLADDVRGSMKLGVVCVISDEAEVALDKRHLSRFGWQVNGVRRTTDELKSADLEHCISFALEKSRGARLEVALADRITGWALVTHIQLRPVK